MTNLIRLSCHGRDLVPALERSIALLEVYGVEWCGLAARACAEFPGAVLQHPSQLPSQEALCEVHAQLEGLLNAAGH